MSDDLGMIAGRGCAINRMGECLLRSLGATQITLRIADPSSGDTGSQIGLEPPPAEDLQIYPAAVRWLPNSSTGKRRKEVLLSAITLKPIAKNYGVEDILSWLLSAEGVLHCDQLMHVESVVADQYFGSNCLYHLMVTE